MFRVYSLKFKGYRLQFIVYRFQLKIFVKILVRISSISDAIPKKSLHKARNSSAFLSKIMVKDYIVAAYLSDRLFLALGHILTKISSKDFQPQATKNTEYIEDGCQLIFAISLLGNYFCPYRTQVYILHQVLRVLPWAKETIGLSARCCLCIKNHMSSLLQNILRSNPKK